MRVKTFKKLTLKATILLFWILAWYTVAMIIKKPLFLPTPYKTLLALIELIKTKEFYNALLFSLSRVIAGLSLGIVFGITLAFICHKSELIRMVCYPMFAVIKATPVATFIVLLWILVDGNRLAIIVALLMVMPIVWQNTLDGFKSIPKDLLEVAEVYELSYKKKFKILIVPILTKYIYPSVITSVGLAWKSEIAAEIIAYTKNSIGMYINDAKTFMITSTVYAWTVVIVCMSILLETLTKKALGRLNTDVKD